MSKKEFRMTTDVTTKISRWFYRKNHTAKQTRNKRFYDRVRRTGGISKRDRLLRRLTNSMAKSLISSFTSRKEAYA